MAASLQPLPAQHGDQCVCRVCGDSAYADLLLRADYQRQELSRLEDENKQLRQELAVERFRRLTLIIDRAIAANDRDTWSKACAERMALGVSFEEAA